MVGDQQRKVGRLMVQAVAPVHFPVADREQARQKAIRLYDSGREIALIADIVGWPLSAVHAWIAQRCVIAPLVEREPEIRHERVAVQLAKARLKKEIEEAKGERAHAAPYRHGALTW